MLDAAGTTAAVAVQDTEARDRVVVALADWGPQVGAPCCWLQHADVTEEDGRLTVLVSGESNGTTVIPNGCVAGHALRRVVTKPASRRRR